MESAVERAAVEALEHRLQTLLPALYQDAGREVRPASMGSAGLKYDAGGRVAWDEMWATFCDLAMAGGPPHKGSLLAPASRAEIAAASGRHAEVVAEICRGVTLVTDLDAAPAPEPGWVRVTCLSEPMAGWLMRAIVMENVAAQCAGVGLELPAGPGFRLEKEIKNVITVVAKTCHYWVGHMPLVQRRDVGALFAQLEAQAPLIEPVWVPDDANADHGAAVDRVAEALRRETGLTVVPRRSAGWIGLECGDRRAAIWMMRALVASNVLARREETTLFVPFDPVRDPEGQVVAHAVGWVLRTAAAAGLTGRTSQ